MTVPTAPALQPPVATPRSTANVLVRVGAFIAGALIVLCAALISFGTALLAPLGMWATSAYQRRRGAVSRPATWLSAMAWVAVGMLALVLIIFYSLPAGSMQHFQYTADSVSVANQKNPPPAWLDRVAPGTSARAARGSPTPKSLRTPLLIWSAGVAILFVAALGGSIAWAGTMLCGFAIGGRWPYGPMNGQSSG